MNTTPIKKPEPVKKPDFEKSLGRLEEVVRRLESPQLSLDDAMKLFEEGVELSRECQKQLEEAGLLVIHKVDLLTPPRLAALRAALKALNPNATVFAVSAACCLTSCAFAAAVNESEFGMVASASAITEVPARIVTLFRGDMTFLPVARRS